MTYRRHPAVRTPHQGTADQKHRFVAVRRCPGLDDWDQILRERRRGEASARDQRQAHRQSQSIAVFRGALALAAVTQIAHEVRHDSFAAVQ